MQRRSKEWRGEAGSEDWSWMRSFITAVRWSCCVFREWRNGTGCVHHGVMMHNGASCCSLRRQGGTGGRALLFHAWRRAMCTMARDQRARDLGIRLDLQSPRCGEYGSCNRARPLLCRVGRDEDVHVSFSWLEERREQPAQSPSANGEMRCSRAIQSQKTPRPVRCNCSQSRSHFADVLFSYMLL